VRYFASLDGIRCASIVGVIWHHTDASRVSAAISRLGFLGVDMFFVLSGFLIVTLLLRERASTGAVSLRRFYARRALRIFPVYYGLLLALVLAYGLLRPKSENAATFFLLLPFYLTYTSNWIVPQAANLGPLWSLAAEEQFYVAWPAVEKVLRRTWLYVLLAAVILANQLINFGLLDPLFHAIYHGGETDLPMLDATFTPIALGVCLAHALNHRRAFGVIYRALRGHYSPLVCLASLLLVMHGSPADISGWPRLTLQLLMALFLASCVVREPHCLRGVLTWYPVRRLGTISYGMYLYHMWTRHVVLGLLALGSGSPPGVFFLMCLLLTALVAELSYRGMEAPILRIKERFTWRRGGAAMENTTSRSS
jgi:peptidoglycan/LPS O-acetylase OafA/YrhL